MPAQARRGARRDRVLPAARGTRAGRHGGAPPRARHGDHRARPPAGDGPGVLEPLENLAARQGWTCGTHAIVIEPIPADAEQAQRLAIGRGDPLTRMVRTKTRDGEPLAVMESVVPEHAASYELISREFVDSTTRLMAAIGKLRYAQAAMSAGACPEPYLPRLQGRAGHPGGILEELFFGDDEEPLAWNLNYFLPELIRLEILRKPAR